MIIGQSVDTLTKVDTDRSVVDTDNSFTIAICVFVVSESNFPLPR